MEFYSLPEAGFSDGPGLFLTGEAGFLDGPISLPPSFPLILAQENYGRRPGLVTAIWTEFARR